MPTDDEIKAARAERAKRLREQAARLEKDEIEIKEMPKELKPIDYPDTLIKGEIGSGWGR